MPVNNIENAIIINASNLTVLHSLSSIDICCVMFVPAEPRSDNANI